MRARRRGELVVLALVLACRAQEPAPGTALAPAAPAPSAPAAPAPAAVQPPLPSPVVPVPPPPPPSAAEPVVTAPGPDAAVAEAPVPPRRSPCPPGTCVNRPGGRCERPTGQRGNMCCRCGANGRCASPCRCNGPDLPVATPGGPRRIADLRVGDLVYSLVDGARVVVPVRTVRTRPAPTSGWVRVELDDGTSFVTSAVHPLADGRQVEALAGDPRVRSVTPAAAPAPRSWDILPASPSGVYLVGGIPFASTLRAAE